MNLFGQIELSQDQFDPADEQSQPSAGSLQFSSEKLLKRSKKINKRGPPTSSISLVKKWFSIRTIGGLESEGQDSDMEHSLVNQIKYEFDLAAIEEAICKGQSHLKLIDKKSERVYQIRVADLQVENLLEHQNIQKVQDSFIHDVQHHRMDGMSKEIKILHKKCAIQILEYLEPALEECYKDARIPAEQWQDLLGALEGALAQGLVHPEIDLRSIYWVQGTLKLSNNFQPIQEKETPEKCVRQFKDCLVKCLRNNQVSEKVIEDLELSNRDQLRILLEELVRLATD